MMLNKRFKKPHLKVLAGRWVFTYDEFTPTYRITAATDFVKRKNNLINLTYNPRRHG